MASSYVVTCQKSTAVLSSLVCRFSSPFERNVIIARGNFIEIHLLGPEGLLLLANLPFYGKISSIDKIKSLHDGSMAQELIFVMTERKEFCILGYDMTTKRVVCHVSDSAGDNSAQSIDRGAFGMIDPDSKLLGLFVAEGILKVYPIEHEANVGKEGASKLKLKDAFIVHIERLNVVSMSFLHGCSRPTLCVLFEDHEGNRHVKTLVVDIREREALQGPWQHNHVERTANLVIPVPAASGGGIILVGQSNICYLNGKSTPESIAKQPTVMCVYSAIDAVGSRYLLGDQHGVVYVLLLRTKPDGACAGLVLSRLGVTSIPSSINYLDNGIVFVGSRFGDAQLVKVLESSIVGCDGPPSAQLSGASIGESVEVLETFPNFGPILDMCMIPQYKAGGGPNSVVVTCSGAYKDGSLRVIRSGVRVQEQASMDVVGTLGIWSLKKKESNACAASGDTFDKYLIQTYIGETRILCLKDDELEECEIDGVAAVEQSIYCGNVINGMMVQITSNAVRLVQYDDPLPHRNGLISQYVSPTRITVATANMSQILLVASGGLLTYLVVDVESNSLVEVSSIKLDKDVACLSLLPLPGTGTGSVTSNAMDVDTPLHAEEEVKRTNFAVVGMWTDESIRFIALPTNTNATAMVEISNISLQHKAQIRDILLVSLGDGLRVSTSSTTIETTSSTASMAPVASQENVQLLCGMGDGTLITFVLTLILPNDTVPSSTADQLPTISSRRKVSIGSKPISLSLFLGNSSSSRSPSWCVFAACDCPTIIYQQHGRLLFSAVNLPVAQEVTLMTSCHSALFPRCLALVNNTGLMIGTLDDEIGKLHVISHPLGEGPRRICYSAVHNLFAVCTQKTNITARGEVSVERVLFLDSDTFEQIHVFELEALESVMACACVALDTPNGVSEYFVIGTAVCVPNEAEPSNGRLLLFEVSSGTPSTDATWTDVDVESENMVMEGPDHVRTVEPVCIHMVKGAVFSVVGIRGHLAAGIGSKVQTFKLMVNTSVDGYGDVPELKSVCSHNGHILALYLKAQDDLILVGDLLRSVSLLKYTPGSLSKLEEVARDYNTNPMRAVEFFDDPAQFSVGAEDHGNIFILKRNLPIEVESIEQSQQQNCLAVHAEYHVGDSINVMRAGSLCCASTAAGQSAVVSETLMEVSEGIASTTSCVSPSLVTGKRKNAQAFLSTSPVDKTTTQHPCSASVSYTSVMYGTVSGAIGAVLAISKDCHMFFSFLEHAMRLVVRGSGGFSQETWRHPHSAPCTDDVLALITEGFVVDGDLIEIFVDLSIEDKSVVVKHFNEMIELGRAKIQANTSITSEKTSAVSSSITDSAITADIPSLFAAGSPDQWTVEAVVQRVEDMIRLH